MVDADSIYSKDLSVGPVRSLERLVELIRDKSFNPDASRSNYWPRGNFMGPHTPRPLTMLPRTPGLVPQTPMSEITVKGDTSPVDVDLGQPPEIVEVSASSSSSSSESSDQRDSSVDPCESDCGEQVQQDEVGAPEPVLEGEWFRHTKSHIVHAADRSRSSDSVNHTLCGRRVSSLFAQVRDVADGALRCQVCFKHRHIRSFNP